MVENLDNLRITHPLASGAIISSTGGHFTYRIIGPCCRLFDREQLPWPCCRLQWRGKEPSWRRIGRRFIPDLATRKSPSYSVEILEPGYSGDIVILTLYETRLDAKTQEWWHSRRRIDAIAPLPSSPASTYLSSVYQGTLPL